MAHLGDSDFWGPFLQAKIREWLEDGKRDGKRTRTDKILSDLSAVTPQHISQIKNHAIKAGLRTAMKLQEPLGFTSFDQMKMAADAWWASQNRPKPRMETKTPGKPSLLKYRDEWDEVKAAAIKEYKDVSELRAFDEVGETEDRREVFPDPLTVRFVGEMADFYARYMRQR